MMEASCFVSLKRDLPLSALLLVPAYSPKKEPFARALYPLSYADLCPSPSPFFFSYLLF